MSSSDDSIEESGRAEATARIARAIQEARPPEPLPPDDRSLADQPRNDLGNARRLIARHGHDLIHVDESGYHIWTRKRWEGPLAKGAPEAEKRAHQTAEAIIGEAKALEVDVVEAERDLRRLKAEEGSEDAITAAKERVKDRRDRVEVHRRFGTSSGNSGKIAAMLAVAAPYLRRRPRELDADPMLLNVDNGTLELDGRVGEAGQDPVRLVHHRREDLITRLCPVAYDPEAQCRRFLEFLRRIQPDPELSLFLQVWFGYCLTGDTREQQIVLCHGKGANGKSTLLGVIAEVLGDYAAAIPIESFLQDDRRRGGEATPDIVRLLGCRLALASEPEPRARLSEAVIKRVTGGEKMTARKLFEGMFEFAPTFKLVLSANERPRIRGQDEGIWRRVLLVPFEQFLARGHRDKLLSKKLLAEKPGILNWLLDGLRIWLERGLVIPEKVQAATDAYRRDSDPIGQFVRNCVRQAVNRTVQASTLYATYVRWCRANGVHPASNTSFGLRLTDLDMAKEKRSGVHVYLDIDFDPDGLAELEGSSSQKRDDGEAGGQPGPAASD